MLVPVAELVTLTVSVAIAVWLMPDDVAVMAALVAEVNVLVPEYVTVTVEVVTSWDCVPLAVAVLGT